jgi:hypothetical protein
MVTKRRSLLFACVNIVIGRSYCSEYEEAMPTLIEVDFPLGHNPGCGFSIVQGDILLKYAIHT